MKVVCAGDCGVDRYVDLDVDRPAGKTLNTAVTARRIFDPDDRVEVVTVLGRDPESGLVTEALARFSLSGSIRRGPGRTSVQYIDRAPSGEKIFLRYDARRRGKLFVVTFGPDGSLAVGGDRRRAQPALAVDQIVDTTGAGDVFAAGFLQEYCTSRDVPASLAAGARIAAESIQRVGAF